MSDAFGDEFELYDLRVEVLETGKPFVSHARVGDTFDVIGGRIVFPQGREASFSLYAMMAVLPFLPAKQRPTHPNDWMTTDTDIASLDPACGARFRITRLGKRTLRHADYSALPLEPGGAAFIFPRPAPAPSGAWRERRPRRSPGRAQRPKGGR